MNSNFEFSSEKPTFVSLSKPRLVKSRKSGNPRSNEDSNTLKIYSDFNPFRPVSENDGFKAEKVSNDLVDEIRKLKIENQSNLKDKRSSSLNSIQLPSKDIVNDMKSLNLGGGGEDFNVESGGSFGSTFGSGLPSEFGVGRKGFGFGAPRSDFVFGGGEKNGDKSNESNVKEMGVNERDKVFDYGIRRTVSGGGDRVVDPMISDEMEKLKIGGNGDRGDFSSLRKELRESMRKEESGRVNHVEVSSVFGEMGKHASGFHVNKDGTNKGLQFESSRDEFQGFRTPNPKGSSIPDSNQKFEFSVKKRSVKTNLSKGRKGKLKEPTQMPSLGKSFTPKENSFQAYSEPSESFSPMDVSPYREIQYDKRTARETSLSSQSSVSYSDNATNEDLTECMDINKDNSVNSSMSVSEGESFKSTFECLDRNEKSEAESFDEVQSCDSEYFSASSSITSGGSSFTFAASTSTHGQSSVSRRDYKKKNSLKAGPDLHNTYRTGVLSDTASSLPYSPMPRVSGVPFQLGQKETLSTAHKKGVNFKVHSPRSKNTTSINLEHTKGESTSPTAASRSLQEACEKWRIRGNQAYSSGDLEKADEYYSKGLSCIPQSETSRDCLRALVLCYSNRAATRMSVGRMRDALRDCLVAAEIDPNFFRVLLRAANCYLALGEVSNASQYFKKLLQSPDVCVDRKLILEASDGIQKAQKVSECMDRSAELLVHRALTDVESALGVIDAALLTSPYSELLLERKAEAFFTLHRYEEVMKLCEQTLEAAEKNSPCLEADGKSSRMEASELLMNYSFRIWRYSLIFKSNFYLGKLEEALDYLEKHEQWKSMMNKYGNSTLESLIPQVSTARELIRLKTAGNEAFQAGRHTEAVEHYTSALSLNIESRPFAAVCFGNRAAAHQALGQITAAIADCSLAIALDGNYLKALSRRATLFEMIRDYEQAAKDLERFMSLLNKQAEQKANQSGVSLPMNTLADLRQARQRLHQMEEQAMKDIPLNFYLILGVEQFVTAADLKKAYRKAALKHHPDKAGQSLARSENVDDGLWKEIAEEVRKDADRIFKMIGEAYAVVSDPNKRSQYDVEEEMRNGQRKTNASSMSRMHTDSPFYTSERSGGSGRQWRETGRSSANPYYRGFEPTRPSRYQ